MTRDEFNEVIKRLTNPFSTLSIADRADLNKVLTMLHAQGKLLARQSEELNGAKQTMIALVKSQGTIEVPYAVAESLNRFDGMRISDEKLEDGSMVKRFSYVMQPAIVSSLN